MNHDQGASTRSPWEQFGIRNNFGKWGKKNSYKESAKAKKKRLKGTAKIPRRKKKKKELFQSHFNDDGGISYNDAEAFGDKLASKPPQTFRVGGQNVQLLPENARNYKSRQLVNHIREGEYDMFMMEEIGLFWEN